MGDEMRKLRVFIVAAAIAVGSIVVGAAPASAKCVGEPVNPCVVLCQIGLSNKYTEPLFRWCYVV